MQVDLAEVVLRFALYVDLMLLFGMPLYELLALQGEDGQREVEPFHQRAVIAAAASGILLSLGSLVVVARSMTGASEYAGIDSDAFATIVTGTGFGEAWVVRMFALAACLLAPLSGKRTSTVRLTALATSGIALASLAWAGHGAMDDGMRGFAHLAADVVHLLAAGSWFGALVLFMRLSSGRLTRTAQGVARLSRTSSRFAGVGTWIVAALVLTGAINYALVVGPTFTTIFSTAYGVLLLVKLGLFGAMLGLAAANRYRLAPRLEAAMQAGDYAEAVRALRRSLRGESACAVIVLGLVAWLGVLSPLAD